jgi:AraC-like DNA-binding protein
VQALVGRAQSAICGLAAAAVCGYNSLKRNLLMQLSTQLLLDTPALAVRDVVCAGSCRGRSEEECAETTCLVFPYRGVFVRDVGRTEAVAEANQLLFFNEGEGYRISHPVEGGDACLSLGIGEGWLRELAPAQQLREGVALAFRSERLRIDARTQALVALIRHNLSTHAVERLEAETLVLTLVRRALGERTSHAPRGTSGRRKLVDRAKLVLSSDLTRRWTLADIAAEVGVSPVYLTQVFQQVEGMPLYRYQLRLRLARALHLIARYHDLTRLGLDLGFSSHSHFTASFRQVYGRAPAEFRRSIDAH